LADSGPSTAASAALSGFLHLRRVLADAIGGCRPEGSTGHAGNVVAEARC